MVWKIEDYVAGVWHGAMTAEEIRGGGVWLLRTDLPETHPGRVISDPWFQLWTDETFHFERGLRVGPVQRRESIELPYGGRWEYVRVAVGSVTVSRTDNRELYHGMMSGSSVCIGPTEDRTWWRTAGGAVGCRICSYEKDFLFGSLCPATYQYYPIQTARDRNTRLGDYINSLVRPGFQRGLLIVYEGQAEVLVDNRSIEMQPNDYLYLDEYWFPRLKLSTSGLLADLTLFNPAANDV